MKLNDMSDKLNSLSTEIKRVLSVSGYEDYSDLSCVDYDNSSSEDLLLMDEYNKIVAKLSDINDTLTYLTSQLSVPVSCIKIAVDVMLLMNIHGPVAARLSSYARIVGINGT